MSRLRRVPLLALAPVLAAVALLSWVFASPIGAGPDDDYHLVSTWCAGQNSAEACAPASGDPGAHRVPVQLVELSCFQREPRQSAACQHELFAGARADETVVTTRGNFFGEYPPLFYAVMSVFAGDDVQLSALGMRAFTVVVFVSLLTALYLLLPAGRRPTLLLGWMITTIPLGVFILAANNPSAWAVIGVGSSWLALLGYFETRGWRRGALGAVYVVAMLMAAGSRGDAAVYAGFATVLVLGYTFRPRRDYLLAAILPVAMGLVALAFLLQAGQIGAGVSGFSEPAAPSGGGGGDSEAREALSGVGLLAYNVMNAPFLWVGSFGEWGLGWLDTGMPALVVFGALGTILVATFLGLRGASVRKLVLVGLTFVILWILPVYVLQQSGQMVGESLQPRYLLPLVVLFGGLVALDLPRSAWSRGQLVLIAAGLAIAHAVALHQNMRRYLTGAGNGGLSLDAGVEWWWAGAPFSPMVVWVVGALAYGALVLLLALRGSWADVDRRSPALI